ncbi:MAG: 4-hydroxythreonine-4-phosphate dehydrogenase PdxA [Candidatus Omnitrophota bacterium]
MSLETNRISRSSRIKVGITLGDPSGIGAAIIAKALPKVSGKAEFVVIGDKWVFDKALKQAKRKTQSVKPTKQIYKFIDLDNVKHKNFRFGQVKAAYGKASIEYLDKALELIRKKEIDCLVTSPVSKEAVALSGLKGFCGHTQYFAQKTGTKKTAMFLLNKYLKFGLVTTHVPVSSISVQLTRQSLRDTVYLVNISLRKLFGIRNPRIAVTGLNPHASDNGLIGDEENRVIKPELVNLRRLGLNLDGPLSADAAITKAKDNQYDAVIVMYHDQALIPLKLLSPQSGVNLTLGLPFVRTSPLHGTAFDKASLPHLADPHSLIEAVNLAIKCALRLKNT